MYARITARDRFREAHGRSNALPSRRQVRWRQLRLRRSRFSSGSSSSQLVLRNQSVSWKSSYTSKKQSKRGTSMGVPMQRWNADRGSNTRRQRVGGSAGVAHSSSAPTQRNSEDMCGLSGEAASSRRSAESAIGTATIVGCKVREHVFAKASKLQRHR